MLVRLCPCLSATNFVPSASGPNHYGAGCLYQLGQCETCVEAGGNESVQRSVGDQRDEDEISLKGDYEFKENKNRENGGEKKEQAVEKREDVDHREDVDYHRARTKMSSHSPVV